MRDDRRRQRLRAERARLVDHGLAARLVERHLIEDEMIGELEHDAAMVARTGEPPDLLSYWLRGDDNRRRRGGGRRAHRFWSREIRDVRVHSIARDLQVELQILVHVRRQAPWQLHARNLLVVGEASHDCNIAHVRIAGHRYGACGQGRAGVNGECEGVADSRRDVDELLVAFRAPVGQRRCGIERRPDDGDRVMQQLDAPIPDRRFAGARRDPGSVHVIRDVAVESLYLSLHQIAGKEKLCLADLLHAHPAVGHIDAARVFVHAPHRQVLLGRPILAGVRRAAAGFEAQRFQRGEAVRPTERGCGIVDQHSLRRRRRARRQDCDTHQCSESRHRCSPSLGARRTRAASFAAGRS